MPSTARALVNILIDAAFSAQMQHINYEYYCDEFFEILIKGYNSFSPFRSAETKEAYRKLLKLFGSKKHDIRLKEIFTAEEMQEIGALEMKKVKPSSTTSPHLSSSS